MASSDSSPPAEPGQPSLAPRRHAQKGEHGPGIAKPANLLAAFEEGGIGRTLRELRASRGLSIEDFAAELGVHEETLRRWEKDQIQIDRAVALHRLLGRNVA